jgi:hypothetical protein
MSSFLSQSGLAASIPKLAASLKSLGATSVDVRCPEDGSLALRTTLGSLLTLAPHSIDAGEYLAVVGLGSYGITAKISIDNDGRVRVAELERLVELLSSKVASWVAESSGAGTEVREGESATSLAMRVSASRNTSVIQSMGVPSIPRTQATSNPKFAICAFELPVPGKPPSTLPPKELSIETLDRIVLVGSSVTDRPTLVQILSVGTAPLNAVLPVGARLQIARAAVNDTNPYKVTITFGDPFADSLIELRTTKQFSALQDAVAAASNRDLFVPYSQQHPGASVLIGYALLRAGQHALVEEAIRHVHNRRAAEPDATILLAECAARAGEARSAEALELFVQAVGTGIPCFTFGLSYVVERLRLFEQSESSDSKALPADANARARGALRRIEPFSMFADHSRIFTAYAGVTPDKPGAAQLSDASVVDKAAVGPLIELP